MLDDVIIYRRQRLKKKAQRVSLLFCVRSCSCVLCGLW